MRVVLYIFFSICLCIFFLHACTGKDDSVFIDVSNTSNIATSSQWAVITEPYVAYRVRSLSTGDISAHGRVGDIIEVIGSDINISGKTREVWYQFENGWLPETSISMQSNKLKAEFVSSQMQ